MEGLTKLPGTESGLWSLLLLAVGLWGVCVLGRAGSFQSCVAWSLEIEPSAHKACALPPNYEIAVKNGLNDRLT